MGAEGQRGKHGRWELLNATLGRTFRASAKWLVFCTEVSSRTPHFRAPTDFVGYATPDVCNPDRHATLPAAGTKRGCYSLPRLTCCAHCMACRHSPHSLSPTCGWF